MKMISHRATHPLQEADCDLLIDRVVLDQQYRAAVGASVGRGERVASDDGLALHVPLLGVVRQHAVEAFEQLAGADRFGQISGEAQRCEPMDVAVTIHRGEHHQPRVRQPRIGVDAFAERRAVHVVHAMVGQHHFERLIVDHRTMQQGHRFDAAGSQADFEAGVHELPGQHATIGFVVVHDQDAAAQASQVHGHRRRGLRRRRQRQREPEA
jgi:hypothetical protein